MGAKQLLEGKKWKSKAGMLMPKQLRQDSSKEGGDEMARKFT